MTELEAKIRCLEVAERLAKAQGKTDPQAVVEIQMTLYAHVTGESVSVKSPSSGPRNKRTTP